MPQVTRLAAALAIAALGCGGTSRTTRTTPTTTPPRTTVTKPRPANQATAPRPAATPPAVAPVAPGAVAAGTSPGTILRGKAVYYGSGKKTASGERFDKRAMTAAHRTLPFGTWVRVTVDKTGKSVAVRINDRGPFGNASRIIDLTEGAARKLGIIDAGVAAVTLEILPGAP
ncbi:MAG: septal ring lytic transglycosylase RlpA family protein [Kofleriaceae bacterium]